MCFTLKPWSGFSAKCAAVRERDHLLASLPKGFRKSRRHRNRSRDEIAKGADSFPVWSNAPGKWSETNPTLKAQFKSVFRGKTT
jgi:hypothetical protein